VQWNVAGRPAAGQAFEQHDAIDPRRQPKSVRGAPEGRRGGRSGTDSVRSSQRQMGPERPVLALPTEPRELVVEIAGEIRQRAVSVVDPQPERPRPAAGREGTGTRDGRLERLVPGRDPPNGVAEGVDPIPCGRTQEPECHVEAVEPHPADAAAGRLLATDVLHEPTNDGVDVLGERHGDEQPASVAAGSMIGIYWLRQPLQGEFLGMALSQAAFIVIFSLFVHGLAQTALRLRDANLS